MGLTELTLNVGIHCSAQTTSTYVHSARNTSTTSPAAAPGELQAIKAAANPSSNDVFIKDTLQIRKTSQFERTVHFGQLHIVKKRFNSTDEGSVDPSTCVTEWDIRTLQRQPLCPGVGNPNGEGLISATIFGLNQTYPGAGTLLEPTLLPYYNPVFLSVAGATRTGSLSCEDTVQYQDGLRNWWSRVFTKLHSWQRDALSA